MNDWIVYYPPVNSKFNKSGINVTRLNILALGILKLLFNYVYNLMITNKLLSIHTSNQCYESLDTFDQTFR